MLQKSFLSTALFCFLNLFHSQSFTFERSWGSYVGGTGNYLGENSFNYTSLFSDSQQNIYVNGYTSIQSGYNAAYYNQFVNGGGNNITLGVQNNYAAKFSSNGQMLRGSYDGTVNNFERIVGVDFSDNIYVLKSTSLQVSNLATANVWLDQNIFPTVNLTLTLSKYDVNNNLLWTTYIPNNTDSRSISLRFDENQNIYLLSRTEVNIPGLSTTGVFQENYIPYTVGGNAFGNSYMVKLNSSGQKVWGTFSVPNIFDFRVFNNELFLVAYYAPSMPGNFTDSGTFQPNSTASNLIFKFNASTGQKIWGTFYGPPISSSYTGLGINGIDVNATGIYVSGQNEDFSFPTYFATSGAHKNQLTDSDLFLSKFDFTGNRVWSTYFGSTGYDIVNGTDQLTVWGNKVVLTGTHYGAGNISTPGAFLETVPNPSSTNMYFAEFSDNGNLNWASYYGGTGQNYFGEYINARFLTNGSLILWGITGSPTGIGTEGAAYQYMTNPYPNAPFGYIAKFNIKGALSTSELKKKNELQLYDNPNNGNFYLEGDILEKESIKLSIFDISGKLIHQSRLEKKKINQLNLQHKLSKGNYLVQISSEKGKKLKVFKMTVK